MFAGIKFAIKSIKLCEAITGLIGEYAHGNEPCHHVAYLYRLAGQPHKTEALVNEICTNLYKTFHMTYSQEMDVKPYILAGGVNEGINSRSTAGL